MTKMHPSEEEEEGCEYIIKNVLLDKASKFLKLFQEEEEKLSKKIVGDCITALPCKSQTPIKTSDYSHAKENMQDGQDKYPMRCLKKRGSMSDCTKQHQRDKSGHAENPYKKYYGQQVSIDVGEHPTPCRNNRRMQRKRKQYPNEISVSGTERVDDVKSKKQKRSKDVDSSDEAPPPLLPLAFKNRIRDLGGSNEMFVLQKIITITDTKKSHDRLLIPFKSMKGKFLKESEEQALEERKGRGYADIKVSLIQPSLKTCEISLRKWNMQKKMNKKIYTCLVLNSGWHGVLDRNGIRKDDSIQLWSFRDVNSKLCFALVNLG